jgi:ferredoxin
MYDDAVQSMEVIKWEMKWEVIKMLRKIIRIDEGKCTGCALCAEACHEGAIAVFDGKAKLLRVRLWRFPQ